MEQADGVRRTLDMAKSEINRQNPDLALEYLRRIQSEIDGLPGSADWAEHQLLYAEALCAKGDPAADDEFQDALERIRNLVVPEPAMELRAYEHYGHYLDGFAHRPSLARRNYDSAKSLAVQFGSGEDRARIQLRIVKLELEMDHDPRLDSFRNLKKAARESHSTAEEQLAVWIEYCGANEEFTQGDWPRGRRTRPQSSISVGCWRL